MQNLLEFLIELANTPSNKHSELTNMLQKQSAEVQFAFQTSDLALLKRQLSDNMYFANERTVAQIKIC